jgi:hypothetical protein
MKLRLIYVFLLMMSCGFFARPASAQTIVTCQSQDGRLHYCHIDEARVTVELARQLSNSPCVRGESWGNDNRGIWVDRGCRAEFRVAIYDANVPSWWNSGRGHRPDKQLHDVACFFIDANYGGDYFCQGRGSSVNVPPGFNDKISSIRVFGRADVTIYNDANFGGFSARTRRSIPVLREWRVPNSDKNWNNRISSVRVE